MNLDREQVRRRRKRAFVAKKDGPDGTTRVAETVPAEAKGRAANAEPAGDGYRKVLGCRTRPDATPVD